MKARISIKDKLSSDDFRAVQDWARGYALDEFRKRNREATRRLFQLISIALNDTHGFGKDRLTRLFSEVWELMRAHDGDPEFWEHVNKRCRQIGVDFTMDEEG